jgi:outer membrane protein
MKTILIAAVLFFFAGVTSAQLKIGYIDSDTVMDKLPDAQDARKRLDAMISEWQSELNKMEKEWKTKYDDYERRKLILTDASRAELEAELIKLEQQIAEYREKKFGTNGELFQQQDEIMKPIQNKVFTVIQEVAKEEDLDFVFDRSGDIMLLYAKEQYDMTAKVLDRLKLE